MDLSKLTTHKINSTDLNTGCNRCYFRGKRCPRNEKYLLKCVEIEHKAYRRTKQRTTVYFTNP